MAALHQLALADERFAPEERQLLEQTLAQELPGESLAALHHPGDGALADGSLGEAELTLLHHWSELLQVGQAVLADLQQDAASSGGTDSTLERLRGWLDAQAPGDAAVARLLMKLIPAQCPFERDVVLLGRQLVHIPPMGRINPLHEPWMALRFGCLGVLAGEQPPPAIAGPTDNADDGAAAGPTDHAAGGAAAGRSEDACDCPPG